MAAVDPKPVLDHPFAQRLTGDAAIMQFVKLLACERRPEIGVVLANEHHRQLTHGAMNLVVARHAALA